MDMQDTILLVADWLIVDRAEAGWMSILAAALWALLLARAFRRPDRRRLVLRLTLITMAIVGLLLAGLRPGRKTLVDTRAAILITPGADPALVDSLQRTIAPGLIAAFDSAAALPPEGVYLPNADYFLRRYPDITELHLVGSGLPATTLEALSGMSLHFYPGPPPMGIVDFRYTGRGRAGDSLRFNGSYRQTEGRQRRLFLEGPHGKDLLLASDSAGQYAFTLSMAARRRGRYLFQIVEEDDSRRVLQRLPVPVLIDPSERPRVLILNHAPAFETKYLKNWLADHGYAVAVRSLISRDRYKTEFYNTPERELVPIRPSALSEFDLAVIAGSGLPRLAAAERDALRRAVNAGLGLVILGEEALPDLPATDQGFFFPFSLRSAAPRFQPASAAMPVELPKAPYIIRPAFGVFSLLRSSTGGIIAAYRLRGEGRIALQLANATYQLLLEGRESTYQQLWSELLEATARRTPRPARWELPSPLLTQPRQPLTLRVTTAHPSPTGQLTAPDSTTATFYFRQSPLLPDLWEATVWPSLAGWHHLQLLESEETGAPFYVPPADAWDALRQTRRQAATTRWLARQAAADERAGERKSTSTLPYPQWWWYLLFLAAAGGLWLEEKL